MPEDKLVTSDDALGRAFLQRDIDHNRRAEWLVVLKAVIALALVAGLVVIRQVYFQ
jgi:hypothetical protein